MPARNCVKSRCVQVGIDLIRRLKWQRIDDVLRGADERFIVDVGFHGRGIEQPGLIVWVFCVRGRATGKEVPANPPPGAQTSRMP